jgi:uncharacterized protein DUF3455
MGCPMRLTRLCRAVGVGVAVATATVSMTQVAHAQPAAPAVPANLVPPTGSEFLVGHAKGVQIYTCKSVTAADGTTSFSWAFVEPRADLVADNGQLIKHSKGPKWSAEADGSAVSLDASREVKRADSPAPDRDIPWLLVPVGPAPGASNDEGDPLTGTTFIQRLNTQGGTQPPNAECQAQTAGKVKEVPYKADYIFFK